jgi:hypothetical protein
MKGSSKTEKGLVRTSRKISRSPFGHTKPSRRRPVNSSTTRLRDRPSGSRPSKLVLNVRACFAVEGRVKIHTAEAPRIVSSGGLIIRRTAESQRLLARLQKRPRGRDRPASRRARASASTTCTTYFGIRTDGPVRLRGRKRGVGLNHDPVERGETRSVVGRFPRFGRSRRP